MKVKYYKEDDLLLIKLSQEPYDFAEMEDGFIVHFSKKKKPVRIEVLNASRLLKETSKALPKSVIKEIFSAA